MLRLDGEASEVDEPGESLGKWVKRTFFVGEEDEFKIGEPCEEEEETEHKLEEQRVILKHQL